MTKIEIDYNAYMKLLKASEQSIKALKNAAYIAKTTEDREIFNDARSDLEIALGNAVDNADYLA